MKFIRNGILWYFALMQKKSKMYANDPYRACDCPKGLSFSKQIINQNVKFTIYGDTILYRVDRDNRI